MQDDSDLQRKSFFEGGKFTWKKSESEVWTALLASVDSKPAGRSRHLNISTSGWILAASFALLLSISSFLRIYTTTIQTAPGEHLLALLPDGSTVELNAQSTLKYQPYWWRIQRKIDFEGEGFFNVEKGRKFSVVSAKGQTEVLGTTFNIFSRDEAYSVTCLTGKVRVTSLTLNEVILNPNSKANIKHGGKIEVQRNIETFPEISWKKNIFLFTATPLYDVFAEIERQYGIDIAMEINQNVLYSGNFNREQNVEEILSYICPALGLKYIRKSAKSYLIITEDE
jgi:ferric-dicitrate binding protein FerR (iron transport regulator)